MFIKTTVEYAYKGYVIKSIFDPFTFGKHPRSPAYVMKDGYVVIEMPTIGACRKWIDGQ